MRGISPHTSIRFDSMSLAPLSRHVRRAVAATCIVGVSGCTAEQRHTNRGDVRADSATAAEGVATGVSVPEVRFVRNIAGFQGPESVKYDAEQDVFFVSNMTGYGSALDGNGYISRLSAANPDSAVVFAQGGRGGVTLDAPKGMAIHGDTLWVADIQALRG